MPLTPTEIMLAKIWANSLVIVVAAALSLWLVVQGWLGCLLPAPWCSLWPAWSSTCLPSPHSASSSPLWHAPCPSLRYSPFLYSSSRHHHEFALRWQRPLGQHAAVFTEGDTGLTVDAFCKCCPGYPVPRGRLRRRVAGVCCDRGHWCRVLRRCPAAFSQSTHRDAALMRTVVHGHVLQARSLLQLLLSR